MFLTGKKVKLFNQPVLFFSHVIILFFTLFNSQSFYDVLFLIFVFNTSFIMPIGHDFSIDEKTLIFKVINFCEQEETGPIVPLNNVIQRVSMLLGISERSVNRMKKELNELIEQEPEDKENDVYNLILDFMGALDTELATSYFKHVEKVEQTFKDADSFLEEDIEPNLVEETMTEDDAYFLCSFFNDYKS